MKKSLFIILGIILFNCSYAQLLDTFYTVDNNGKIHFTSNEYYSYTEDYPNIKPYVPASKILYKSQGKTYTVEFLDFKGWEDDPGFARVFYLYCNGKKILEFIDELGWCKIPEFTRYNSVATDDCLIFRQKNNVDVIVIEGYPYESQPRTLVIAVQGSQAKVVYFTLERKFHIESVRKDSDGYFEIRLEDDWVEEGPNGYIVPKSYTMKATATGMYLYKD